MDFFQRVGNFFNGAGWVSDEEKKRKQRQQVQQQPKRPTNFVDASTQRLSGNPTQPKLQPNTPQVNPLQKSSGTFHLPTLNPQKPTGDTLSDRLPTPSVAKGNPVQVFDRRGDTPIIVPKPTAPQVPNQAPYIQPNKTREAIAIQSRAKSGAYKDPTTLPIGNTDKVDFRNPNVQPTPQQAAIDRLRQVSFQKKQVQPANPQEKARQISEVITRGQLDPSKPRLITPEEEAAALKKRDEINKSIANKGKLSAGDITNEIGKATKDVLVNVLRSLPRSAVQLGQDFTGSDGYKADNPVAKFLLGKDEVKSSQRTGAELLSGLTGKDVKEFDNSGSALLGGALALADIIPGAGGLVKTAGKVAGKEIIKSGAGEAVKPAIKTLGELFAKPKETLEKVVKRTSDNVAEQDAGNTNQAIVHQADKAAEEARLAEEAANSSKLPELTDAERAAADTKPAKPLTVQPLTEEEAARIAEQTRIARTNEANNLAEQRRANPDITPEEEQNLIQKSQERMAKTEEDIRNSVLKSRGQVDEATAKAAADVQAQQKVVKDVQDAQKEAVAPADGGGGSAPTPSAELQANHYTYSDAANQVVDSTGTNRKDGLVKGNALYDNPLTQLWNRIQQGYIGKVDSARNAAADQIQKGIQSDNKVTAALANAPKIAFKNFGQSEAGRSILIKRTSQMQNAGRVAKLAWKDMEKMADETGNPQQVYQDIYRVLEEPQFLERVYGDATKLTPDQLNPQERAIFDKLVEYNKMRNDINYQTGIINAEQHAAFADGMHSPRIYDIKALGMPDYTSSRFLNLTAGIKRKDFSEIPDALVGKVLESPIHASMIRLESSLKNLANSETLDNLANYGALFDKAPNKNFVQLVGKKYGDYEGKFIDSQLLSQIDGKDYFTSSIGQKTGDLVDAIDKSPVGGLNRILKSFKTTLSPGTFTGNVGSNIVAFSGAANVNPGTAAVRMAQGAKQLAEATKVGFNPNVHRAELAGLFSGNTGKAIIHDQSVGTALKDATKNPYEIAKNVYGGADQAFALGLFNEFKARGLSDAEAVSRAHLAMQNYGNAGRGINLLADSPILGKPFARFTPELLRIMKNSAIYNPVGTATKIGVGAAAANKLSEMSGETPDERKARENAVGQTQLPFTGWLNSLVSNGKNNDNVSLNIPIPHNSPILPDSSVNIARATGLNYPIEPGGDANSAVIRQLNPFADLTRTNANGKEVFAPNQVVSSLLLRPIADQIVNRDFMGRTITDPTNKVVYENGNMKVTKLDGEPSQQDQTLNRLRTLAMNYLPGANEGDALFNATKGQKDYYGKDRTIPEAIARTLGFKVESNTQKDRTDRVAIQNYFDEKLPAVQDFLDKNPDLAGAYFKINNPAANRQTGKKVNDIITPEKWSVINSDTSGRLFDFMKQQAITANKEQGKPVDPIYVLDPQSAKYVADLRSRPTGDDLEATEILKATTDWYPQFEKDQKSFYDAQSEWYKAHPIAGGAGENDRVKAYRDAGAPVEQPPLVKQYYQIKSQDAQAAKNFYKANADALSQQFDAYAVNRLGRINALRKIEGYPPISLDTFKNNTFGFDAKGGSSYGGYSRGRGGGGGGANYVDNLDPLFTIGDNPGGDLPLVIKPKAAPDIASLLEQLKASGGGNRKRVSLGASSRGQG